MQLTFGSGVLWGTPLTDSAGNAIANPTPVPFGVCQDVSVEFSADIKELFGQSQFPFAVGRGKAKISCKAKNAQIYAAHLNSIFFGQTLASGILGDVYDVVGAVIPATPFQITPTVPSSGTWSADLGVRNSQNVPLTRVASAPTTGQYSVAAGVYTFAAADTGQTVYISYQYTATSTVAKKLPIANVLMGQAPQFRADLTNPYGGKQFNITLNACIATKLAFATKLDDFGIPEFDFSAFADAAGNIGTLGFSE